MKPQGLRRGLSLLELVVAVAIVAVLVGLLLAAVQAARGAAVRTRSLNNLRQLALGLQHLVAARDGRLPGLVQVRTYTPGTDDEVWSRVIRFVDDGTRTIELPLPPNATSTAGYEAYPLLICPADPTAGRVTGGYPVSYVWNAVAFEGLPKLTAGFPDGTASTIAFAGKYHRSNQTLRGQTPAGEWVEERAEVWSACYYAPLPLDPNTMGGHRRPTFADAGWGDVVPVTDPATGTTRASVAGMTFQVRPAPEAADVRVPHTPFAAGLPVSLFDGSVRILRPGIAEGVFWALVTPRGGEIVGDW